MNCRIFFAMALLFTDGGATQAATGLSKAEHEGQALARQLLAQKPAEDSTIAGVLKTRDGKGKRTELPVRCSIIVTTTNWQSVYETVLGTNEPAAVRLTVIHSDSGFPEYRLSGGRAAEHPSAECVLTPGPQLLPGAARDRDNLGIGCTILLGDQAMIPFAGSDFWVADFGLEFLHWPEQRLLKKEMRRGQSCNVLESLNPQPGAAGYARVVSWLDIDTGGIVHAEAYDARRRLLKEFDPKEFKKVNGRWELREMEIRNVSERSSTRLEFNLEKQ